MPLLLFCTLFAGKASAQPKPEFKGSTLRVVRPGRTESLRLFGESLAPESVTIKSPLKARFISAKPTEKGEKGRGGTVVVIEVTVPEKTPADTFDLVLNQGKERITVPIMVLEAGEYREIKEPATKQANALLLLSGGGVFGSVPADRCVYYRFEAKAGEVWEVRVRAGRLGSALDAVVRIRDSHRVSLALGAGDERKDRKITFHVRDTGVYTLEVGDAEMRGGGDFVYALSLWRE